MTHTEVGATVSIMVNLLLPHRYLERLLISQLENVGYVVVAGLFLMDMADRTLCLHIVEDVAVRVVLAVAV
tara:strand:+ start:1779 stop:1991 length:213 start_codon:yes stop_codon:yes gene_type:complete